MSTDPTPASPSNPTAAAPGPAVTPGAVHEPTASQTASVNPPQGRRARASDVVWGCIIVFLGVGLFARAVGVEYDTELALIIGLAAAGLALVLTAVINGVRRR